MAISGGGEVVLQLDNAPALNGYSDFFSKQFAVDEIPRTTKLDIQDGDLSGAIEMMQGRVLDGMGAVLKRISELGLLDQPLKIPVSLDAGYGANMFAVSQNEGTGEYSLLVYAEMPLQENSDAPQVIHLHMGNIDAVFQRYALSDDHSVTKLPELIVNGNRPARKTDPINYVYDVAFANMFLGMDELVEVCLDSLTAENIRINEIKIAEDIEP